MLSAFPNSAAVFVTVLTTSLPFISLRVIIAPAEAGLPFIVSHFLVTLTVTLSSFCFSLLVTTKPLFWSPVMSVSYPDISASSTV